MTKTGLFDIVRYESLNLIRNTLKITVNETRLFSTINLNYNWKFSDHAFLGLCKKRFPWLHSTFLKNTCFMKNSFFVVWSYYYFSYKYPKIPVKEILNKRHGRRSAHLFINLQKKNIHKHGHVLSSMSF